MPSAQPFMIGLALAWTALAALFVCHFARQLARAGTPRHPGDPPAAPGIRVAGRVVASHPRNSSGGHRAETVEFTTQDGLYVRAAPRIQDVDAEDRTGQRVAVYYDPAEPGDFLAPLDGHAVRGPDDRPPLLLCVLGLICTVPLLVGGVVAIVLFLIADWS